MINPWPDVGDELDDLYNKRFFYHQGYYRDEWWNCVIPNEDNFFGTKVLNIFIAMKPYGWTQGVGETEDQWHFDWGDPDSSYTLAVQDARTRWVAVQNRFPYYKTNIYVDTYRANQQFIECPQSDVRRMMTRTTDMFQDFCATTPGFEFKGVISSMVPASFFQEEIDEFYANPIYYRD
jgi:hypothetical protein